MTAAFITGALTGLALFLFVYAVTPQKVSLARRIALFEADNEPAARRTSYAGEGSESGFTMRLGAALARLCAEQGWEFPSLRANLDLVGRSFDNYLATSAMLAVLGLLFPVLVAYGASMAGLHLGFFIPLWASLVFCVFFAALPYFEVKGQADKRRRDFRHAIGAFLDLVAMNLSGGRGVPEALMAAGEIGDGWAFWRIRDALSNARITGQTPWQALGALGDEVQVNELKDLSAALGLVAEDGAKVRESLSARAASLRRRELADLEGQAGEKSQSMLVAQMLLAVGFLIFLIYPAISILMSSLEVRNGVLRGPVLQSIARQPPVQAARGAARQRPGRKRDRTGDHYRGAGRAGDRGAGRHLRLRPQQRQQHHRHLHPVTRMGRGQLDPGRLRQRCRGLVERARSDRGASAIELAILTPLLLLASFMIITFAMWFFACHAALAAAQEGDLVAREEADNPVFSGNWQGDAQKYAVGFYHGLNTSALTSVSATASLAGGYSLTGGGTVQDVSVTVTGSLNWLWSMTISETVSGPEECFHTAASGGTACQ